MLRKGFEGVSKGLRRGFEGNGAFWAYCPRLGLRNDCRDLLIKLRLRVGLLPQANEDALARQRRLAVPDTLGVLLVVERSDLAHEVFRRRQPIQPRTLLRFRPI